MRVIVAPNAFKGSLSPFEAARAMARGVRAALPGADIVSIPIADGGDGTAQVLSAARGGVSRETIVPDPLGRPVRASFSLLDGGTAAVLDVASASGLALLDPSERDPLVASSRGTGKLLRAALDAGATTVILGLGGSATVDGGAGLLSALGVHLQDESGAAIPPGGAGLAQLSRIDTSRVHPALAHVELRLACDVDTPLLGARGAARGFAPQKGATPEMVLELERNLARFAELIQATTGRDVVNLASGGAAGGIGAGLCGVLGATLESGVDLVLDAVGFDDALQDCDWVFTGEGFLDWQSARNKGPAGVARWARHRGVPVVAIVGGMADGVRPADFPDFTGLFSMCPRPIALEESMLRAAELLELSTERTCRALVR